MLSSSRFGAGDHLQVVLVEDQASMTPPRCEKVKVPKSMRQSSHHVTSAYANTGGCKDPTSFGPPGSAVRSHSPLGSHGPL